MMREPFNEHFEELHRRIAQFGERLNAPAPPGLDLCTALQELHSALEELHVAEEELRQQQEELLATNQELEAERHRYRDLFEFAPDGYLVTSADGRIQEVNRAGADLLGVPAKYLHGKPLISFITEEDRSAFRSELPRLCRAGQVRELPARLQPRDRQLRHILCTVGAFQEWGGGPVRLRWLIRDVTEHKQAEDGIRALNTELEQRVAVRTAELRTANEALRERDRRKDDFLAVLGHELRNPLAAIRNAVHLLGARGEHAPTRAWIQSVLERQSGQLGRLVDDLLDISRITRDKIHLRREYLDLAALVRTTAEDHRPALEEAGLTLAVETPDEPLWADGDPVRLAQVLGNLLQNARKFSNSGGRVTVRAAAEPAGVTSPPGGDGGVRGQAVIVVRDTGIGIAPELLPRLFMSFVQADDSLDRSRGGLGLGLALVKGIVELHGGTVEAATAGPGQGSTFTFRLPLAASPRQAPGHTEKPAGPRYRRVLIVDDNRDGADSLRYALELRGHRAAAAYSGPEALELAPQFGPDVILCDLGLPHMDGFAVICALRQDPRTAAVHAVAVTGYSQDDVQRRCPAEGFDMHLTKPVDLDELCHWLEAPAPVKP